MHIYTYISIHTTATPVTTQVKNDIIAQNTACTSANRRVDIKKKKRNKKCASHKKWRVITPPSSSVSFPPTSPTQSYA